MKALRERSPPDELDRPVCASNDGRNLEQQPPGFDINSHETRLPLADKDGKGAMPIADQLGAVA
jgi:hypothetical protein